MPLNIDVDPSKNSTSPNIDPFRLDDQAAVVVGTSLNIGAGMTVEIARARATVCRVDRARRTPGAAARRFSPTAAAPPTRCWTWTTKLRSPRCSRRSILDGDDVVAVYANFAVWHFRRHETQIYVGRFVYHQVRKGESFAIRPRRAELDPAVFRPHATVSIILTSVPRILGASDASARRTTNAGEPHRRIRAHEG